MLKKISILLISFCIAGSGYASTRGFQDNGIYTSPLKSFSVRIPDKHKVSDNVANFGNTTVESVDFSSPGNYWMMSGHYSVEWMPTKSINDASFYKFSKAALAGHLRENLRASQGNVSIKSVSCHVTTKINSRAAYTCKAPFVAQIDKRLKISGNYYITAIKFHGAIAYGIIVTATGKKWGEVSQQEREQLLNSITQL